MAKPENFVCHRRFRSVTNDALIEEELVKQARGEYCHGSTAKEALS